MPTDELIRAWLEAVEPHVVSLWRPERINDGAERKSLRGTGVLIKRDADANAELLTAHHVHCAESLETHNLTCGEFVYAAMNDYPISIGRPRVTRYHEEPSKGPDFSLFGADYLVDASDGNKRALTALFGPPAPLQLGDNVVVIGFPEEASGPVSGEPHAMRAKLHGYPGTIEQIERFNFRITMHVNPPYAGAIPISAAKGLSGAPCFRIRDDQLTLCGIHRAANANETFQESRINLLAR